MKNKISVIVPIYNEFPNLKELLERLHGALTKNKFEYEIIFIDDNSTDKTESFFKRIRNKNIIFAKKQGKKGKAYSLKEGFAKASGNIVAMIDADLQYPPEAIPLMANNLSESADIVVSNRVNYKDSGLRRLLSKTFRGIFGKHLFGLNHDIQSGLKVFKKEVVEIVNFEPSSAWTFDLEFLHRARHAGYEIKNMDITFEKRKNGNSSVQLIKTTLDIGINALKLKTKIINPIHTKPSSENSMLGASLRHKKNLYITHTTLSHEHSAVNTFTINQKIIIFFLLLYLIIGFIKWPLLTLQIFVGVLSFIYFADVFFNLYVIMKSLTIPQEIVSTEEELAKLKGKDLPVYTILCPLYREAHIIPQFLKSISELSWPTEKLDVILLLEEDDTESIEDVKKMKLPKYVRVVVVPHSIPKTKPKACNYGLAFAKGEYLVVYDAEDMPDPMQLKKAFLGFTKVDKDTICLQAKLNYYNPHQNLLTRFFTAEYSLWFDVTLTGLQSIGTTIPLGGTSNHFKTESLRGVEAWDPFNVTEDADLGMRLFRKGYKTAIIDSVTLEEANSNFKNWLRQRSRWLKGYMQTYLVHARDIVGFSKEHGRHSLIFQLIIGGKIAFVLINPFLWIATFAYFALYSLVGPQIEKLYPSIVFYMAVVSLVFGNFLFVYYYMIGVAKKGQWSLMKYVTIIPLYWIGISIAAFIALYQLIFKPHYWEKTIHGLHLLKKEDNTLAEAIIKIEKEEGYIFTRFVKNKLFEKISRTQIVGTIFVLSAAIGSFLNYLFNAYLGRTLSLEDFALVGFIGSLYSFTLIIAGSFGTAIAYKTGYLLGKNNELSAFIFWKRSRRKLLIISALLGFIWIAFSPFLAQFFNEQSIYPILFFAIIIFSVLAISADRGYLSSRLSFGLLAFLVILEPLVKLITSFSLVNYNLNNLTYISIPVAVIFIWLFAWLFASRGIKNKDKSHMEGAVKFPVRFFMIALVSGISSVILLNFDVVMAKHYLSSSDAGLYALISLIGKMIFFLGSLATPFIIPLVSRNEGANKDSQKVLKLTLAGVLMLVTPLVLMLIIFGKSFIPLLFGVKILPAIPYLIIIAISISCFTIARVFVDYYVTKKYYIFSLALFFPAVLQIILIASFHNGYSEIIYATSISWISSLIFAVVLHKFSGKAKIIENNIVDFFGLFVNFKKNNIPEDGKQSILIFNWRDTRHKWSGGAEVYIHELAKRWVKDGNNVTIFCGNDSLHPHNEIIDGVQIYRRGGFYTVYIWAFLYYILKFRGKYDVIIDSENGIPFFTPLFSRVPKFLLIHHVHQEVFRKSLKWPLSWIALFLEAKVMPFVYRNTQVITVSPSSKEEILKHKLTKKDPIIIYNGVDLDLYKPAVKNKNPMVLYLGRLQYYKSLHVFIVAAKRVLKKVPNAEFVIAGEGEEKEKLIEFAKKQGVLDKIKFMGKVTEKEKIELYQKAWVFVNPSFMEGWGITTIEANACGTPALASDVPGLKDSIKNGETGYLEKYGRYEGFAKKIINILKDEKLRKSLSENAKAWAQNYSWDKSSEDMYLLIKNNIKVKNLNNSKIKIALDKIITFFLF